MTGLLAHVLLVGIGGGSSPVAATACITLLNTGRPLASALAFMLGHAGRWLENNTRPIAIVLFAAFGILLLAKGASGLWARRSPRLGASRPVRWGRGESPRSGRLSPLRKPAASSCAAVTGRSSDRRDERRGRLVCKTSPRATHSPPIGMALRRP